MSTSSKTVIRVAALGNKWGNIRIRTNPYGEKVIIIDDFAPVVDQEDEFTTGYIPYKKVLGKLESDITANCLIRAVCKKLVVSSKGLSTGDVLDLAIRKVMSAIKVKCTYVLRVKDEVFTKSDGTEGKYKTNWYELIDDDIHLSFGDKREDYLNCNVDAFAGDKSLIEDF